MIITGVPCDKIQDMVKETKRKETKRYDRTGKDAGGKTL